MVSALHQYPRGHAPAFDVVDADAGTAGKNKTPMRIIVPRGKATHAEYAAEATGPILELLEDYFGMPYPYEKLDQIAIPNVGFAMCLKRLMSRSRHA